MRIACCPQGRVLSSSSFFLLARLHDCCRPFFFPLGAFFFWFFPFSPRDSRPKILLLAPVPWFYPLDLLHAGEPLTAQTKSPLYDGYFAPFSFLPLVFLFPFPDFRSHGTEWATRQRILFFPDFFLSPCDVFAFLLIAGISGHWTQLF